MRWEEARSFYFCNELSEIEQELQSMMFEDRISRHYMERKKLERLIDAQSAAVGAKQHELSLLEWEAEQLEKQHDLYEQLIFEGKQRNGAPYHIGFYIHA